MVMMTLASHVASHLFFLARSTLSHLKHVLTLIRHRNKADQNNYICPVSYRPWDELPDELMEIILQNHTDMIDRISTSMVCISWASIFKQREKEFRIPPPVSPPWLLLPSTDPLRKLSFYDMSHAKLYHFKVPRCVQGARCCGSSKGWLIMLTRGQVPMKAEIFILNPVSGTTHKLPSLKIVRVDHSWGPSELNDLVSNIQLSCEDPANCVVASYIEMNPCTLVFCGVGSHNWKTYDDFLEYDVLSQVLFSKDGKILYALKHVAEGVSLSVTDYCFVSIDYELTLTIIPLLFHHPIMDGDFNEEQLDEYTLNFTFSTPHLVESNNGEILLIRRCMDALVRKYEEEEEEEEDDKLCFLTFIYPKKFEIYMLHAHQDTSNMTKLTSLDNQILFFSSIGLSLVQSKDFPELQGNCIYFMESELNTVPICLNYPHVSRESGIYHIEDGRFNRCFPSIKLPVQSHIGWFNPNLF